MTPPVPVPRAMLDTSVLISMPDDLAALTGEALVSTISLAELAFGLHVSDPVESAARQARYQRVLDVFEPIPYSAEAARTFGALADAVRRNERSPRPRRFDLLLASVALSEGVPLLTRNPRDFADLHRVLGVIDVA